jgi:hypothetical protein
MTPLTTHHTPHTTPHATHSIDLKSSRHLHSLSKLSFQLLVFPFFSFLLQNIRRAFWIFKLCRCPPIPQAFLTRPEGTVRGENPALWGLLSEIMKAYPNALEGDFWGQNVGVCTFPYLTYSAMEKRSLDKSLAHWLLSIGIISPLTAGNLSRARTPGPSPYPLTHPTWSSPHSPSCDPHTGFSLGPGVNSVPHSTLLAWEGSIRDGTVLCDVCDWLLQVVENRQAKTQQSSSSTTHTTQSTMYQTAGGAYNPVRRTYVQSVLYVQRCLTALRCVRGIGARYLSEGRIGGNTGGTDLAEMVVRGSWDVVWGLLEDVRR